MRRILVPMLFLGLSGCVNAMPPQTPQPMALPLTDIQSRCFANHKKFVEQSKCIDDILTANSHLTQNSQIQEYIAYLHLLDEQVKQKRISGNQARLKLTSKLNELKALQLNQLAIQEQLDMQRAAHNAEVLRQYQTNQQRINEAYPTYVPVRSSPIIVNQTPQYQVPPIQTYQPPKPTVTECHGVGNQMVCTSGESKY